MNAPRVPKKAGVAKPPARTIAASVAKPACKGCGSTTRKLLFAGPRCTTCHRDFRNERKIKGRERRQNRVFGITLVQAAQIEVAQGGGCICAPWTGYVGKTRALSTDHDHKTGVIRGRLCKHCNDLLGRVRDDPRYFQLMADYLRNPPAVRLFGPIVVPDHEG